MSIFWNFGAQAPSQILQELGEDVPRVERRSVLLQAFLDALEPDEWLFNQSLEPELKNKSSFRFNTGVYARTHVNKWYNVKNSLIEQPTDKKGNYFLFEPRLFRLKTQTNKYIYYKYSHPLGSGSFGEVYLFTIHENFADKVDESRGIFKEFAVKVPKYRDYSKTWMHEEQIKKEILTINYFKKDNVFGDIMCASARQLPHATSIILMEPFLGNLSDFNNKLNINDAFQILRCIHKDCVDIFNKTGPNLIYEDMKLENCLYSGSFEASADTFTVCVGDLGGFIPNGFTIQYSSLHSGYFSACPGHLAFCYGLMIVKLLKKQTATLLGNAFDEFLEKDQIFVGHENKQIALQKLIDRKSTQEIKTMEDITEALSN